MTTKRSTTEESEDAAKSPVKRVSAKWSDFEWKKVCHLKDQGLSFPWASLPDLQSHQSEISKSLDNRSAGAVRKYYHKRIKEEVAIIDPEEESSPKTEPMRLDLVIEVINDGRVVFIWDDFDE